jgi:hypothetical protein
MKWLGREADHSFPSSADVMNGAVIPSLLHTSSMRDAELITERDNFTLSTICTEGSVAISVDIGNRWLFGPDRPD